jgi:hypothetical protein
LFSNSNGSEKSTKTPITLDNIFDKTKNLVKKSTDFVEDKITVGYDDLKTEGKRLDKQERLIGFIPNSVLVFGAVAILIYSIAK